jgi:hypothetical protein
VERFCSETARLFLGELVEVSGKPGYFFVLGNSGQLRFHDPKPFTETGQGFDTDRSFALVVLRKKLGRAKKGGPVMFGNVQS